VRRGLRSKFHALLHRCRQRKSLRVVALGQCLRHFANRIDTTVGEAHGERVRRWFETKKAGWYAVLEDPKMPAMSTVLDQAHNAMDRKLFAMNCVTERWIRRPPLASSSSISSPHSRSSSDG
jgi:hypothetical protein